jgi:hypothetical protein
MVGKSEGRRPIRRPRRSWVDNIKMDLGEIGWSGVDWICLAQVRDKSGGLSRSTQLRSKFSKKGFTSGNRTRLDSFRDG